MHYRFPEIRNITDVLPAIEGRDEFKVIEKDGYTVINYVVVKDDTFEDVDTINGAIRRECRGLIFDSLSGDLFRRPFHKFFNVNEREETQSHQIDLRRSHTIYDKLDGSMVTPFKIRKRIADPWGDGYCIRWGTKMGITEVSQQAEVFVAKHPQYSKFAKFAMADGSTPIFEWCTTQQQIVLEYKTDRLVLLAVRDNLTGEYYDDAQVAVWARDFDIEMVDVLDSDTDMNAFIAKVKDETDIEGYVISFDDDGHKVKIKTDWYVRLHKAYDMIRYDKNIAQLILNDQLDDLIPSLMEDQVKRVTSYEKAFWRAFNRKGQKLQNMTAAAKDTYGDDRKAIAINVASKLHKLDKAFLFKLLDGKNLHAEMITLIKSKINTNTNYDQIWDWLKNV